MGYVNNFLTINNRTSFNLFSTTVGICTFKLKISVYYSLSYILKMENVDVGHSILQGLDPFLLLEVHWHLGHHFFVALFIHTC